jgi:hypothetical protein
MGLSRVIRVIASGPRAARPIGGWVGLLMLALSGVAQVWAAPGQAPSTLLLHAQLAEALSFASETARQRGWAVVATGPASVTFEQPLDSDADGAVALLRITATGIASPGGVTVSLAAQEVRPASGTAQDVTQRYRDNLLNALDSLATKWGLGPGARPPVSPASPPVPTSVPTSPPQPGAGMAPVVVAPVAPVSPPARTPAPSAAPPTPPGPMSVRSETPAQPHPVGTWAYYAERYAEGRGCTLADLGAVLEGRSGGVELHRVYCTDGRQLLVRCATGSCGDAR